MLRQYLSTLYSGSRLFKHAREGILGVFRIIDDCEVIREPTHRRLVASFGLEHFNSTLAEARLSTHRFRLRMTLA